jgi:hypothetical protein
MDGVLDEVAWFFRYKYQTEGETWVPLGLEMYRTCPILSGDRLWFTIKEGGRAVLLWRVIVTSTDHDPIQDRWEIRFPGDTPPARVLIGTPLRDPPRYFFGMNPSLVDELEKILR